MSLHIRPKCGQGQGKGVQDKDLVDGSLLGLPCLFPSAFRNGSMDSSRHLKVRHLEQTRLASLTLSDIYIWNKQEPEGTPAGQHFRAPFHPFAAFNICRHLSCFCSAGRTRRIASVMIFNRGIKTCPLYVRALIPSRSKGVAKR